LSALSPDPELRPKTLAHGSGLKTFLEKCRLGDKGDKSDSKKYSGALTDGVMPDLLFDVGVNVGICRRGKTGIYWRG